MQAVSQFLNPDENSGSSGLDFVARWSAPFVAAGGAALAVGMLVCGPTPLSVGFGCGFMPVVSAASTAIEPHISNGQAPFGKVGGFTEADLAKACKPIRWDTGTYHAPARKRSSGQFAGTASEDFVAVTDYPSAQNWTMKVAVLADGHGTVNQQDPAGRAYGRVQPGKVLSQAASTLAQRMLTSPASLHRPVAQQISSVFNHLEPRLKQTHYHLMKTAGCTLTAAMILRQPSGAIRVGVGNLGDSRAILFSFTDLTPDHWQCQARVLTTEHNVTEQAERDRLRSVLMQAGYTAPGPNSDPNFQVFYPSFLAPPRTPLNTSVDVLDFLRATDPLKSPSLSVDIYVMARKYIHAYKNTIDGLRGYGTQTSGTLGDLFLKPFVRSQVKPEEVGCADLVPSRGSVCVLVMASDGLWAPWDRMWRCKHTALHEMGRRIGKKMGRSLASSSIDAPALANSLGQGATLTGDDDTAIAVCVFPGVKLEI